MMSNEHEARAFGGETAEGIAEFALRGEVERVGRLVEQELARAMDQRAGDEDAAFFSGRHFADELAGEVGGFDSLERFGGARAHLGCDMEIGPES